MRCPECRSRVWDNRSTRLSAKEGWRQPAFRCMRYGCDWATWDVEWGQQ